MTFSFKEKISHLLSKYDTKDVFDHLISELDSHHNQKVHDMTSLKKREKMKIRGDNWEVFCRLYLLSKGKYTDVWLLKDIPVEVRKYLSLSKKDQGIDIVARFHKKTSSSHEAEDYEYIPVQCKFRAPDKHGVTKRIKWNDLATYVGLCCFTGPWNSHIVMTNAPGIRYPHMERGFDKTYRFHINTFAQGTYRSLDRSEWLSIIGMNTGKTLREETIQNTIIEKPKEPKRKVNSKKKTPVKKLHVINHTNGYIPVQRADTHNTYLNIFY